jgi:hypothetical protein
MIYQWRDGYRFKGDPNEAGTELERLRKVNNGLLIADTVVRAAKIRQSPIHQHFEWDDKMAAHEYRKEVARDLMASLVVTIVTKDGEKEARAFVVVGEVGNAAYTSFAVAMSDAGMRQQVLQRAFKELEIFRNKYAEYEELAAIFNAIEKAKKKAA